ncbi:hypothetical protein [Pantoea stewartii]|uniref:hypothetical protein n=1 Tax=Pantoea stewartii TaxID=66269 RepID=UPI00197FA618|nr:hypothetical protein [Pantoea stewartii]
MDLSSAAMIAIKTIPAFISKLFSRRNYFKLTPLKQTEALSWLFSESISKHPAIRHFQHLKLKYYGFADDIELSRKVILHYINNKKDYKYCNSMFSMRGAYHINNGLVYPKKVEARALTLAFLIWLASGLISFFAFLCGIRLSFSFGVVMLLLGGSLIFVFYTTIFYIYISSYRRVKYISTRLNESKESASPLFIKPLKAYILRSSSCRRV